MEHSLAVALEAEMPRLDDAGMHRPDRDLVDLRAGDRKEIRVADRRPARWKAHRLEPRMAFRLDAGIAREFRARNDAPPGNPASAPDRHRGPRRNRARSRPAHHRQSPASRRVSPSLPGIPLSSNSRPPQPMRASTSRRNTAISRTGIRRDRQRRGVADRRERHCGQPPTTAAALPIASESDSGIHRPSTSSRRPRRRRSGAPNRDLARRRWRTVRRAIGHVDQVPQRRDKDDTAGGQEQHQDEPGTGPDRGSQQLIFAHEDRERRDADQRQQADQSAMPQTDRRATHRRSVHVVAAETLPEPPDREKRQRFADRMVQRVEQRGKGAERPEPVSEGDDPHVLDAVIGEQALRVALEHDEPGRHQDRQRAERDQQAAGEIGSRARAAPAARTA